MLKDLTKADWLGILQLPESRIPAVLVMRGTRNLHSRYRSMLSHFDNVLELGTPNGIIKDVLIADVSDRPIAFNPRRLEHILLSDTEKDEWRSAANDKVIQLALSLATEIGAKAP